MKTVLYVSTKKSLSEKRDDITLAFSYVTNINPTWDFHQNALKFGDECLVSIYHFDESVYRGKRFDYIMESVAGLTPAVLRMCSTRVINKRFFCYSNGARVGNQIFSKTTVLRTYDTSTSKYVDKVIKKKGCEHSWKDYVGLRESFTFCNKCDKRKDA